MILHTLSDKYLADFLRVYKILPQPLQRSTRRVFFCVAVQAVLEVGAILAISMLAMSIAAPERLLSMNITARAFAAFPRLQVLCGDPRVFSMLVAGAAVLFIAAKNAMGAFVSLATSRLGERISLFAGETVFRHFLYSPYMRHLAGDSQSMFQALSWRGQLGRLIIQLMSFYAYVTIVLAMVITLVCFTPGVILLVIAALGAIAIALYKALKKSIDKAGTESAEWGREENTATMNAMNGIRETLIYRQQGVFFDRFREACINGVWDRSFLTLAPSIPTWILETAGFLIILATMGLMYSLLDASIAHVTAVLTMIMLISWRVLPLLNRSLGTLVAVRSARHSALECLKRVEEAIADPAPPLPEPDPDFAFHERICFCQVYFRYPGTEKDCLTDLSFSIPRGTRMGIIGQSGAGKSTVAAMLSGLAEPTLGEMRVDGLALSPAQLVAYRAQVGYVPQNPYILAGTLAENVAFSEWGQPWDEERVMTACTLAELDVAARRGIDIPLGKDGAGLSGGQAQRLSIARALYAEPSILILDEATSALDSGVEKAIMDTIFALPRGITTVTIAHRLTTVERCDSLIWIEDGAVRMTGTPDRVLPEYQEFLEQKAVARLC